MSSVVGIQMKQDHPEQMAGEKFLGYMDRGAYTALDYQSKRDGQIVYSGGRILGQGSRLHKDRLFPVFVELSEYMRHKESKRVRIKLSST